MLEFVANYLVNITFFLSINLLKQKSHWRKTPILTPRKSALRHCKWQEVSFLHFFSLEMMAFGLLHSNCGLKKSGGSCEINYDHFMFIWPFFMRRR